MQTQTRKNRHPGGFTLIELLVVVGIILILAAILLPGISNAIQDAKIGRTATDLKAFKAALAKMYIDVGRYPADVIPGIDPGFVEKNRVPSPYAANWKGPYLDRWPIYHPFGGMYDYEQWDYPPMNYDGVSGNEELMSLAVQPGIGNIPLDAAIKLDQALDDGNLSTGNARDQYMHFYVGEGPCWSPCLGSGCGRACPD